MQAVVQLNAPQGTPVFKLQARDPDTDHNIHYFLVRDRSKCQFCQSCSPAVLSPAVRGVRRYLRLRLDKYLIAFLSSLAFHF